jgi:hypothetical protein
MVVKAPPFPVKTAAPFDRNPDKATVPALLIAGLPKTSGLKPPSLVLAMAVVATPSPVKIPRVRPPSCGRPASKAVHAVAALLLLILGGLALNHAMNGNADCFLDC